MNPSSIVIALVVTAACATSAAAATSDSDMQRCAAIAARDARLDCYDGLAHQLSGTTGASTARTPASSPPAVAVAPAAAQVPPPATEANDQKNFGLTAAQQHTLDVGPQTITANISILSSDQKGDITVVLDNGQTWVVAENDGLLAGGLAVRIRKAAMGSYLMLIPSNHSYHVRRLK